ncbi:MAG: 50S ribosomal protein L24 [Chloroherpetonaceae bacterium]|nr:50S ribosomal protein L24 [bacterium]HAW08444.1 50S ribosomal protein L24 [Bacteroidota bacterium]
MKLKIKKNDTVVVIAGNDKGKTGRVLEVIPDKMRILVEGINIRVKATRPNPNNQQGGLVHKEMPVHYSNVMLMDADKNPSRVGIRLSNKLDSKGKAIKVRYTKSNDKEI